MGESEAEFGPIGIGEAEPVVGSLPAHNRPPVVPSPQAGRDHEVACNPNQERCEDCVAGRGRAAPHRGGPA
eukprot:5350991-Lingulodinium_polyedra.AAC.1